MEKLTKIEDFIEKIERWLAFIFLALMLAVVFWAVIERFIIRAGQGWSDELARYLSIWAAMIGAGIGVRHKIHVSVDAFVNTLGPKHKYFIDIITNIVCVIFCIMLVYTGYYVTVKLVETQQLSSGMELPMYLPYMAVPVGAFLMLFHYCMSLLKLLADKSLTK